MEAWIAGLTGAPPGGLEITSRDHERALAWRTSGLPSPAAIVIELAPSGFGTSVRITAEHDLPDPEAALAALEGMLDELGSPERRPFAGG